MADETQAPSAVPRGWSWTKIALAVLALLVALALVSELFLRGVELARGGAPGGDARRLEIQRLGQVAAEFEPRAPSAGAATNEPDRLLLHPYLGCETAGGVRQLEGELRLLREGAQAERFDLLILGGDGAEELGREALAGELDERLRDHPALAGRRPHFLAFGRAGSKQPAHANFLAYLLCLGFEPRVVILVDGPEELTGGCANAEQGADPCYPSLERWRLPASGWTTDRDALDALLRARERQRELQRLGDGALALGLQHSALLSAFTCGRMRGVRQRLEEGLRVYRAALDSSARTVRAGPGFSRRGEALEACVRNWAESSRSIASMCRARSIVFLHVLPPAPRSGAQDALARGYPRLRQQARAEGERFLDDARLFDADPGSGPDGERWGGEGRWSDEGRRAFASSVAGALLEALDSPGARR
jgi:hypothetical protein